MPVIRPFSGGTPEAMAMPMHNVIATRKTTMEAVKSRLSVPPENGLSMGLLRRLRLGDVGGQTLGVRQRDRQRLAVAQRQETAGLAVQAQTLTRGARNLPTLHLHPHPPAAPSPH